MPPPTTPKKLDGPGNPDALGQLSAASWRGIEFPTSRFRVSIAHDLVEHKYWGVDGARVESTGLAPLRFSFTAPLLNGIEPGKAETWAQLYPNQFRILVAAFQNKDAGLLNHPEFGHFTCKAERLDADWDAARRGGVDCELTFVETNIVNATPREDLHREVALRAAAASLDGKKPDLEALLKARGIPLPEYLKKQKLSLTDFANKINAIADAPTLLSYRASGRVNNILYHAKRLQFSIDRSRSALTWESTRDVERVKANAHEANQKILQVNRIIGTFTVPAATTLAGVARQIAGARVDDLIKLNPGLMKGPEIDKGTVVRHYIAP